ncbi:hypothetical protein OG21DRAFT_415915 [Imleria badia]|nr:hypothetical protein OG21DRAFT_415915 [Imleria badia]
MQRSYDVSEGFPSRTSCLGYARLFCPRSVCIPWNATEYTFNMFGDSYTTHDYNHEHARYVNKSLPPSSMPKSDGVPVVIDSGQTFGDTQDRHPPNRIPIRTLRH